PGLLFGFGNNGYNSEGFYLEDYTGGGGESWNGTSGLNQWKNYRIVVDGNNFDGWRGNSYGAYNEAIDYHFGNNYDFNAAGLCNLAFPLNYSSIKVDWLRVRKYTQNEPVITFGNESFVCGISVIMDSAAPATGLSISGPKYEQEIDGKIKTWITSITQINLMSTDNLSGLSRIEYRLESDSIWNTGTSPLTFNITEEGTRTLWYRAVDNVENAEQANSVTLYVDSSPPVTNIIIGEPRYSNSNTWINSTSLITLAASDNGCGLASIQYKIDEAGSWDTYTQPFKIADSGIHTVFYYSTDNLGNREDSYILPVDEHVVALWRMDEEAGSLVADSIGDNTGTAYGTTIVDGIRNKARSFNGLSDYIDCGSSPSLAPPSFTLSAWVYPEDVSGIQPVIFRGIDGGDANFVSYDMTIQQGQYCVVVFTSGIPGPQGSVGSITANQWHNLAFTYDGATGWGYGYIDGESYALPACNPVIGIPRPDSWNFQIGTLYDHSIGSKYFKGIIGEVSVSDVARTQEEIRAGVNSYRKGPKFTNVIVDNSPPVTTLSFSKMYQKSINGQTVDFITSSSKLTLSSQDRIEKDTACGVNRIEYRIDAGDWEIYSETSQLVIPDPSSYILSFRSIDNLGNTEDANSAYIALDNSPPVSTISIGSPQCYVDTDLWITSASTITLSATDELGCGLQSMQYRIDETGSWNTYTQPFVIPDEGAHTIYYRSIDNLGNGDQGMGVPVDEHTMALWHMDELSGPDLMDATTNANNGICYNTLITDGRYNKARQFVTSDDYIEVPSNQTLQLPRDMTIEAWIYPTAYPSIQGKIVDKGDNDYSGTMEYNFYLEPTGQMSFYLYNLEMPEWGYIGLSSSKTINLNEWHHVAGVRDITTGLMGIYIDGVLDSTILNTYAANILDGPLGIGRDQSYTDRQFFGVIDEVRISNIARTEEEIRASMDGWSAAPKSISVIVDNSPPSSVLLVGMPNYCADGNTFVTLGTPLIIKAVDPSGPDSPIYKYCSVDSGIFRQYSENFTLKDCGITAEGAHILSYYSADCVGNAEQIRSETIILDSHAPTFTTITVVPSDIISIGPVQITVQANEILGEAPIVKVTQNGTTSQIITVISTDSTAWTGNYIVFGNYNGTATIEVSGKDRVGFTGTAKAEFTVSIPSSDFSINNVWDEPDPFSPPQESLAIHYAAVNAAADTLSIAFYDDMGALTKLLRSENISIGNTYIEWDGTDAAGSLSREGIYSYRITAASQNNPSIEKTGKAILLNMAELNTAGAGIYNPGNPLLQIIPYTPVHPVVSGALTALSSQNLAPIGSFYDLQPEGVLFDPPAAFTITYTDTDAQLLGEDNLWIYAYDDAGDTWVRVADQQKDVDNNTITILINHLSIYALLFSKAEVNITPPVAQITSPAQMTLVGNNVEIKGTAKAMLFGNYRLEYGAGAFPDTWTLIEPVYGYPVDSSTLTIWNTTGLEGIYTLKLTVANRIGDTASTQVTLYIDNTPPSTTTLTIGNPKYDYGNGTPFVVTSHTPFMLTCLDSGLIPSDILQAEYAVDTDTSWAACVYTGEDTLTGAKLFVFTIPETYPDAEHTIYYRSVDNVGNYEDSKSVTVILDNTSPTAALIYPSKQDVGICKVINSNTVSIIGTTTDIHFSLYRIELKAMRDGDTPADWTTINEAELQKETQSLGVWNTTQFTKNRWYYIRIVSTDKVNNTTIDTVSVYLGNPEVKLVFGSHGNDNREFKEPYGIAFSPTQEGSDNSGCIFVTDNKNDRVQKFDLNGNFLLSFNGRSEESRKLKKPSGIAVDPESACVFVADRDNDRIQAFDLFGNFLFSFGERHNIKRPEQISVGLYYTYSDTSYACTKAVYVADAKKDRVAIFDYEGNLLATISNLDDPEGVFALKHLQYLGPTQASVYVANTDDNIVTVYTSALTPTFSIKGFDDPRAVYADSRGYIYVSDTDHNKIKRYNRYGELLMQYTGSCTTSLDKPTGICLDNQGNLWIADEKNDRIVKIGAPTVDETMAMRMFSLPKAAMTIKDAYAYPIPFKPNSGLGYTAIRFKLYSIQNVLLRIYNIAGELVFEQTGITNDPYIWSVINNWGEPVVSGVYIYFLIDDTKERKLGKIVVIR
ncbi:hypothetical protein COY52_08565, partial [Candidatus Desantisbacteria bacterium CG_4_10_14_0_8_um_filter_48_22]